MIVNLVSRLLSLKNKTKALLIMIMIRMNPNPPLHPPLLFSLSLSSLPLSPAGQWSPPQHLRRRLPANMSDAQRERRLACQRVADTAAGATQVRTPPVTRAWAERQTDRQADTDAGRQVATFESETPGLVQG